MTENDAYGVLAERHGWANSVRYRRILEYLMTPQQARMVVALPRKPEELAATFNMDVATVNKELDLLFRKGVVFPENFQTLGNFKFAPETMQLQDATLSPLKLNPTQHRELFRLWEDFGHEEWDRTNVDNALQREQPPCRIVPAYNSILNSPELLPCEDARELIKAAWEIALVSCTCRQRKESVGRNCKISHAANHANCIQLNRRAEHVISRGTGTKLSLDEALAVIDETEEDGLIHIWLNTTAMKGGPSMCNCCNDCCIVIEPFLRFNEPLTRMYAKSRYEARVDQELCTGCQVCVDRCQFDAIEMTKVLGSKKLKAVVDPEKCMGCGVCVIKCKPVAMTMKLVRPPEHIPSAVPAYMQTGAAH